MADVNVKRVGVGTPERLAAGFTESSGTLPGFPWAERHKAKFCDVPLVLTGGGYFTKRADILSAFP